ncbi:MAG: isochorismatase family protein [Rhodocyclaceae bacterium]|nr:isochorismatase family protein [Rhodocyclaceae bacterium]
MLMSAESSCSLVVDVEDRSASSRSWLARTVTNVTWLGDRRARWPVLATEQYPKGLGHTISELAKEFRWAGPSKSTFSLRGRAVPAGLLGADRPQVIICGMEAHVCVQQTALEPKWQGKRFRRRGLHRFTGSGG